jgi:heme exporter protein C
MAPVALRGEHRTALGVQTRRQHERRRAAERQQIAQRHQLARAVFQGRLEHHERTVGREQARRVAQDGRTAGDPLVQRKLGEQLVQHEAEQHQIEWTFDASGSQVCAPRIERDGYEFIGELGQRAREGAERAQRRCALLERDHVEARQGQRAQPQKARESQRRRAEPRTYIEHPEGPFVRQLFSMREAAESGELVEWPEDLRQIAHQEEAGARRKGALAFRLAGRNMVALSGVDTAQRDHGFREVALAVVSALCARHAGDPGQGLGAEWQGVVRSSQGTTAGDSFAVRSMHAEGAMPQIASSRPLSAASAPTDSGPRTLGFSVLAGVTALLLSLTLYWGFIVAPNELQMGLVYKILFFHAPSAYAMYIGFGLCALGSAVYLAKRSDGWEALAVAGAEVGLLFALVVMVTGPLWGRKAWGTYWTWDPRLTTTLLIGMIYVAYLLLRNLGATGESERRFAAGLGIIGGALIPIIHYSVQLWRGQHPTVITSKGGGLQRDMSIALILGFAAMTALAALLIWIRARLERDRQRLVTLELDAAEHGLLEEEA